jgi:hypothetical protein
MGMFKLVENLFDVMNQNSCRLVIFYLNENLNSFTNSSNNEWQQQK